MQQPDWRGRGARRPAIEPRKKSSSGCRRVSDRGRQHGRARERECPDGPAWSETLAYADALCAGTGRSRVWPMTQRDRGPQREGEEPSPLMYGREKSDPAIVATKPTNNARRLAAELVERRAGAERNVSQQSTRRAQDRESVSQALERVRQVARQRKKERFTALFHHLSIPMLRTAFFALKRDAAPGVDGLRWQDYERDLDRRIEDLHARVAGRERGRVRSTSLSAPPFQRSARWAAALSRSTLIVTSSMRVRSSSFLSRGVVVGAFQTAARSGPSASRRLRSACEITRGPSFSRRSSSILAVSSARKRSSQSRSRPRATSRLSGSTAR